MGTTPAKNRVNERLGISLRKFLVCVFSGKTFGGKNMILSSLPHGLLQVAKECAAYSCLKKQTRVMHRDDVYKCRSL